jgi:hypothetical protein
MPTAVTIPCGNWQDQHLGLQATSRTKVFFGQSLPPPAENVLVPGGRLARAATARRSEVFGHAHL